MEARLDTVLMVYLTICKEVGGRYIFLVTLVAFKIFWISIIIIIIK